MGQAVVVNIAFDAIEVIAASDPTKARHLPMELPRDRKAWGAALAGAVPALTSAINEMGLTGRRVRVAFRSPSAVCQLTSRFAPSRGQAESAARLAALSAAQGSQHELVGDVRLLGADRSEAGSAGASRHHVLAATDSTEALAAVAALCEAAGLTVESITPFEALVIEQRTRAAIGHDASPRGWLYLGRDRSCFVVGENGRLRLFRQIGFGFDALLQAACRPLRTENDAPPVTLSSTEASRLLLRFGLPDREALLDEARGVRGMHLLPLLQPLFQRLLIELKQSLRFGLGESAPAVGEMQLTICGPLAGMPGVCELVASATELQVDAETAAHHARDGGPGSLDFAELDRLLRGTPGIALLPPTHTVARATRRAQAGLWAGLAAALTFIATDSTRLDHELDRLRAEAGAAQARYDETVGRQGALRQAALTQAAIDDLSHRVVAAIDWAPDWAAVLEAVATSLPTDVRLVSYSARAEGFGAPTAAALPVESAGVVRLRGFVIGSDDHAPVAEFTDRLKACPLFAAVTLGTVERSELDGQPARRFEVEVRLVPVGGRTQRLAHVGGVEERSGP